MSFAPCPSCSRHVKTTEAACPFCKAELAAGTLVPLPGATQRMSRAALFAFTASIAVSGCGGGTGTFLDGGTEGGPSDDGGVQPAYGAVPSDAAPPVDSGKDAGKDATDDGGAQPPYGAPAYGAPPVDGG